MEMHEPQTMCQPGGMEHIAGLDEVGGGETELGIFAAARRPFSGPLREQPHAESDHRLDRHFFGNAEDVDKFLQLFDDQDHRLAKLASEQGIPDEVRVFVAVADDEAFRIRMHGESGKQFGLAAGFDSEMPGGARIEDLSNDFAQLVHFDGKNPAIHALVAHLGNRLRKRQIDRFHPVAQQIVKTHNERKGQMPRAGFLNDLHEIDLIAVAFRMHDDMARLVDSEVATAPAIHIVKCEGIPAVKVRHFALG